MTNRRVLVVTGAGASHNLGVGAERMPLMSAWATSLVERLDSGTPGVSAVLGLRVGMDGSDFEEALGAFLRFRGTLPSLTRYSSLGVDIPPFVSHAPFMHWLANARGRADSLVSNIHDNLFENFGADRYDDSKAESAYRELRNWLLQARPDGSVWYATTNYDWTIEAAHGDGVFEILDGFIARRRNGTRYLNPGGLAETALQANNKVPVLHLHGAVSWYRRDSGDVFLDKADSAYTPALGVPAVMLPDSEKNAASYSDGNALWAEFEKLLKNCTHVLILGHSLNDKYLTEILKSSRRPIGYMCYSKDAQSLGTSDVQNVRDYLPEATLFPCDFGPRPKTNNNELAVWLMANDRT